MLLEAREITKAFGSFKAANDFGIFGNSVTEYVRDDRRLEGAECGKLFGDEFFDANILQADGVKHTRGGGNHARHGSAFHGLGRETFDHDGT